MLIEALGWAAAAFGSLVALPQVVKLFPPAPPPVSPSPPGRPPSAPTSLGRSTACSAGTPTSGCRTSSSVCCSTLVLVQMQRDRRLGWGRLLLPGLALAAITVALDLLAGPVAFAVAALLPALLAQVAQLHALFLKPNVAGVSLGYMTMNVVNQLIWVTWAAFEGESSVLLVGSTLGVMMVLNLLWAVLRRFRLVRARLADARLNALPKRLARSGEGRDPAPAAAAVSRPTSRAYARLSRSRLLGRDLCAQPGHARPQLARSARWSGSISRARRTAALGIPRMPQRACRAGGQPVRAGAAAPRHSCACSRGSARSSPCTSPAAVAAEAPQTKKM